MKFHRFCTLFPDMPADQLRELADDIKANGQSTPIILWDDEVLDGKNRLAACKLAGIDPVFKHWSPKSPDTADAEALAFCISANMRRRQLTESQRAMIAASIANLEEGQKAAASTDAAVRQIDAADQLQVSRKTVQRAKAVQKKGAKPLIKAVESGTVTVRDASNILELPKPVQSAAVRAVNNGRHQTVTRAANPNAFDPEAERIRQILGNKTMPAKQLPHTKPSPKPDDFRNSVLKAFDDNLPPGTPAQLAETARRDIISILNKLT